MMNKRDSEKEEARKSLLEVLKPGDTVFTSLCSTSRSGMSRTIQLHVFRGDRRNPDHLVLGWNAAKLLGRTYDRDREGVKMGGCGMDMGFALVYELSDALFGGGYKCMAGRCPSSYHVNYRSTVRCEGFGGKHCFAPRSWRGEDIPADYPRRPIELEDGSTYPGAPLYTLCADGDAEWPRGAHEVCPTCGGAGELPNPDGPERFDLVHRDGYALNHRWL